LQRIRANFTSLQADFVSEVFSVADSGLNSRPHCYVFVRIFRAITQKPQQIKMKRNGMVVAQSTAIAFVPTKTLGVVDKRRRKNEMLWTIFVILLVLWLLGMVSGYAVSGFIHILLVIALVVLLINVIGGRRPVV
jgi:hypothetical protein